VKQICDSFDESSTAEEIKVSLKKMLNLLTCYCAERCRKDSSSKYGIFGNARQNEKKFSLQGIMVRSISSSFMEIMDFND
jgi:hypothetical protein